ncbi:K02A2.6-like, partial [Cordylochernes scorpioides]
MVETRSGKLQDPAQERIQAEESAKPQPGATIGRDASSDPVVLNPNIDIPKYDGTEDPRPWIESLEEIGFLYHWADYIISRYAAMNMTGSAKTWLNLHKASFTSWENIKIRLIQDFSLDANKEELRMKLNRMQHWNEPAIRFAEDILVLCNKVDPAMEEETKIEHVIGGLKKEYSFALYLNPPKTTDDLLVVCKKMDSFEKKYRERVEKSRNLYNGPRYSRPQQQSRYVPPTAARNYQTTSRPQAPVSNNYKNDSPPTPRQYRNNFPQPSTPRRPYNPNFVPKPNLQRNTYNKSQEVSKNRTEDGRPICFKCNKPGHVARYCRVKFIRILEEDPADTQEKVEEKGQMNEISEKSGPRLYADIFRVRRFKLSVAPESVNQSKSTINGIKKLDPKYKLKINVDKIGTFEALVDTGADLSVVDLRTALDTGHGISKLAKICAGPDGKKLDMVGSIFLNIKIDDETLSHNFVILKTHLRTLILGRDFLKKMNAKIDCKQEAIKYDLTNNHDEINFEMLKIKSAKDSIVPECSMKLIKALVETEDGEYIIEESSKMFQTNGLRLARSLINVINRETHIWITNPYPRPLKIMKNQTLAFGSSPAKINVSREREVEKNEEPRFQINENLSPKEQKELKQVLERYGDLFSSRLGRTNLAKHRIDTEDAKPIKHKPYRVSAKERDIIKEQIDEMLTEGIIRPSSSPWSFPVILVKKRDGEYRFCVDYRKLNNVTVKDVYPIPRIDEVMDTLQGSTHFSAIDLRSGYWQVEVEERDKEKTAFTTAHGLYEFNVMPFGLCNAPATFERNMENMLGNLRWQICLCYLDDVIIYSPDFPTHLKRLEAVFRCFRESNLRLNDKKCRFAFEELEILGYITSKHGIKPAEHNIKAVRNFPRPKKVKEVQSFLGMCSYYRKFIKDFSKIADPLTNLIKKSVSFTWTERQEEAFQTLKTALLSPPILGHFNPNAPTYVHTDASNIGIGATLVQDIGGEEKVISYLSRTLSKAEQNYSTTEKECLAVPIPPANFPFERIGIDFVGPLPSTKNRKKWIIVLTDYYTRYAETRAVSEATVKEVSKFLVEDIFLRHGAPQYLISDRGSQFTSNLMKEVMKTCKIKHCFTTSYHPQTNGLTERLNRTLINMLSMYVNTDQKNWDEILPFITHAYNTTIQETTGYSPFFLMFGREPTSLLDDRNISVDIEKDDYDEYIKHHLDKINRTRKLVINNTIKTQERMKKNYDKKHMERSYEPGELVAVWTPIRKIGKCEKLLRKYFGPYRILKKLSNVNYLIEPKDNPGQDPLIVHVSRLKPYFERIDEIALDIEESLRSFLYHTVLMFELDLAKNTDWTDYTVYTGTA